MRRGHRRSDNLRTAESFAPVWISTVLNLDYPASPTPDAAELARMADEILDGAAAMALTP